MKMFGFSSTNVQLLNTEILQSEASRSNWQGEASWLFGCYSKQATGQISLLCYTQLKQATQLTTATQLTQAFHSRWKLAPFWWKSIFHFRWAWNRFHFRCTWNCFRFRCAWNCFRFRCAWSCFRFRCAWNSFRGAWICFRCAGTWNCFHFRFGTFACTVVQGVFYSCEMRVSILHQMQGLGRIEGDCASAAPTATHIFIHLLGALYLWICQMGGLLLSDLTDYIWRVCWQFIVTFNNGWEVGVEWLWSGAEWENRLSSYIRAWIGVAATGLATQFTLENIFLDIASNWMFF